MNLAQAIHQRWADTAALNSLLAASRVYTGLSFDPVVPFATITKKSQIPAGYANDGSALNTVGVRFQVFHDHYDSAAAIVGQIKAAFGRADFALSGADKVINMQPADDSQTQQDDGIWRFVVDFNCQVYLATGV